MERAVAIDGELRELEFGWVLSPPFRHQGCAAVDCRMYAWLLFPLMFEGLVPAVHPCMCVF